MSSESPLYMIIIPLQATSNNNKQASPNQNCFSDIGFVSLRSWCKWSVNEMELTPFPVQVPQATPRISTATHAVLEVSSTSDAIVHNPSAFASQNALDLQSAKVTYKVEAIVNTPLTAPPVHLDVHSTTQQSMQFLQRERLLAVADTVVAT